MKKSIITTLLMVIVFSLTARTITQNASEFIQNLPSIEENQVTNNTFREGMRYLNGIGTDVNYTEALRHFAALAKRGNPQALNAIANIYRQGLGVEPNEAMAREIYLLASEQGFGSATYNLAGMYRAGKGGAQDFEKAFFYAELALQQGYEPVLYMIGYMHLKGFGTKQNYEKAVEYFTYGTERNQASSTYFLGMCYLGGYGVAKDIAKGKELVERAAALGNDHAVEFITKGRLASYENPLTNDENGNPLPVFRNIKQGEKSNFDGVWKGKILRYDYGGNQVLEIRPLELHLSSEKKGNLSGEWLQNDSIFMNIDATLAPLGNQDSEPDTEPVEESNQYTLHNMHYLQSWQRSWQLQSLTLSAEVENNDTILYGNLTQVSPETTEESSPLMLILKRVTIPETDTAPVEVSNQIAEAPTNSATESANFPKNDTDSALQPLASHSSSLISVYPNPFINEINIVTNASKEESVTVSVYDLRGKKLYSETYTAAKGEHLHTLRTNQIPPATQYLLKINSAMLNVNTVLMKNQH